MSTNQRVCFVVQGRLDDFVLNHLYSLDNVDYMLIAPKVCEKIDIEDELKQRSDIIYQLCNISSDLKCVLCAQANMDIFGHFGQYIVLINKGVLADFIDCPNLLKCEQEALGKDVGHNLVLGARSDLEGESGKGKPIDRGSLARGTLGRKKAVAVCDGNRQITKYFTLFPRQDCFSVLLEGAIELMVREGYCAITDSSSVVFESYEPVSIVNINTAELSV